MTDESLNNREREQILRLARDRQPWRRQEALDRIVALSLPVRRELVLALLAEPGQGARELAVTCVEAWQAEDPALVDGVLERLEARAEVAPAADPAARHAHGGVLQALVAGLRDLGLTDAADPARVERYETLLVRLSDADDADVRYQARSAREHRRETGEDYIDALIGWLEDRDVEVRIIAAQGLARLDARRALAALQAALGRALHSERIHLVLALASLGATGLTDALLDEARRGAFRFPALVALGRYGDEAAIEPLLKIARGWFGEPLHKVAAAAAAARLGSDQGRAMLDKFLASRRPEVRGFALESLVELGIDEAIVERLTAAATDPGDVARPQAIELLGRVAGTQADSRALLERLATDPDDEVREAAEAALGTSKKTARS